MLQANARKALDVLWERRQRGSDLVGTVINIHNEEWVRRGEGTGTTHAHSRTHEYRRSKQVFRLVFRQRSRCWYRLVLRISDEGLHSSRRQRFSGEVQRRKSSIAACPFFLLDVRMFFTIFCHICPQQHYSAIMKYISQPPLLLNVHMHNPTVSVRSWMDSLLAFFPGLQVTLSQSPEKLVQKWSHTCFQRSDADFLFIFFFPRRF